MEPVIRSHKNSRVESSQVIMARNQLFTHWCASRNNDFSSWCCDIVVVHGSFDFGIVNIVKITLTKTLHNDVSPTCILWKRWVNMISFNGFCLHGEKFTYRNHHEMLFRLFYIFIFSVSHHFQSSEYCILLTYHFPSKQQALFKKQRNPKIVWGS